MKNFIIVIIVLVLVGYLVVQVGGIYVSRQSLTKSANDRLDFVDDSSIESVKLDLIKDAEKLGVILVAGNVRILCEDTDQRTYAQQLVGDRIGAQFVNKRVVISIHYTEPVLGIPIASDITASKIKQIKAIAPAPQRAAQEIMNSTP